MGNAMSYEWKDIIRLWRADVSIFTNLPVDKWWFLLIQGVLYIEIEKKLL